MSLVFFEKISFEMLTSTGADLWFKDSFVTTLGQVICSIMDWPLLSIFKHPSCTVYSWSAAGVKDWSQVSYSYQWPDWRNKWECEGIYNSIQTFWFKAGDGEEVSAEVFLSFKDHCEGQRYDEWHSKKIVFDSWKVVTWLVPNAEQIDMMFVGWCWQQHDVCMVMIT